jgi:hypothetical protein
LDPAILSEHGPTDASLLALTERQRSDDTDVTVVTYDRDLRHLLGRTGVHVLGPEWCDTSA